MDDAITNYATVRPGTRLLLTNDDGDELRATLIAKNRDGWELESGDVVLCWTFRDLDEWRIYRSR